MKRFSQSIVDAVVTNQKNSASLHLSPVAKNSEFQVRINKINGSGCRAYSEPSHLINYPLLTINGVNVKPNRRNPLNYPLPQHHSANSPDAAEQSED